MLKRGENGVQPEEVVCFVFCCGLFVGLVALTAHWGPGSVTFDIWAVGVPIALLFLSWLVINVLGAIQNKEFHPRDLLERAVFGIVLFWLTAYAVIRLS